MIKTRGELQDKKLHLLRRQQRHRQRYTFSKHPALDYAWKKYQAIQKTL